MKKSVIIYVIEQRNSGGWFDVAVDDSKTFAFIKARQWGNRYGLPTRVVRENIHTGAKTIYKQRWGRK